MHYYVCEEMVGRHWIVNLEGKWIYSTRVENSGEELV